MNTISGCANVYQPILLSGILKNQGIQVHPLTHMWLRHRVSKAFCWMKNIANFDLFFFRNNIYTTKLR